MNARRVARAAGLYAATLVAAVAVTAGVLLALNPLVGPVAATLIAWAVAALVGTVSGSLWQP